MMKSKMLPILPLLLQLLLHFFGVSHPSKKETTRISYVLIPVTDASIHSHLSHHRRLILPQLIAAPYLPKDHDKDEVDRGNTNFSPSTVSQLARILWRTKSATKTLLTGYRGGAYNNSDDDDDDNEVSDYGDGHPKNGCAAAEDFVVDKTTNSKAEGDDVVTQQPERQKLSRLSLSGPFRMNELTTYEASLADAPKAVKLRTTPTSNEPESIPAGTQRGTSDERLNGKKYNDDDQKMKKKRKRIKKQHSHRSPNKGLETSNVEENAVVAVTNNDGNASNNRGFLVGGGAVSAIRETGRRGEPNNGEDDPESVLPSPLPDNTSPEVSQGEMATKKSNPIDLSDVAQLWWVNMWTHQLSDHHSVDEEDELFDEDEIDEVDDGDVDVEEQMFLDDETRVSSLRLESPESSSSSVAEVEDDILDMDQDMSGETIVGHESPPSSDFVSTGAWVQIDNLFSLGLASKFTFLRASRQLRRVRKIAARATGLHGVLSGKPSRSALATVSPAGIAEADIETTDDIDLEDIQKRIAAIDKAREGVERARAADEESRKRRGLFGGFFRPRVESVEEKAEDKSITEEEKLPAPEEAAPSVPQRSPEEIQAELDRMERVRQIDRLIVEGQARLKDLICEKDVLQRRPNPLFDYTTTETVDKEIDHDEKTDEPSNTTSTTATARGKVEIQATRKMNFPPDDVVAEYLEMMISTRRLTKMNHTYLWKESETDEDEEESIGDDLFTPSVDARRLYEDSAGSRRSDRGSGIGRNGNGNGGGGSWLLRQSIGNGPSLGEKIGQAAETAAYKAVCAALMSFLARALSSLHGINVLKHSDIRLVLEQAPDLPPVGKDGIIPGSAKNYAEETIKTVMRSKARRSKHRSKHLFSEDSFVQRDAVTEMLLSHVQISAPLLKLFPLAWQRALLGNILTLSTAVISDFVDGLYFQILGHQLSFAFRPITEEDMIQHFRLSGGRFNNRRHKPAEFEAAVRATAEDVSEELKFLDRWHERALGSGVLRTQIANMIARIVLTLTDEVLSGARMDLWSAQAGGPRMLACLEYRTEGN